MKKSGVIDEPPCVDVKPQLSKSKQQQRPSLKQGHQTTAKGRKAEA
jgi:hypothetical protein